MTSNPFVAALTDEHRRDLQRTADDYRRASAARPARRQSPFDRLMLRVRPIRPSDTTLLTDMFTKLSPASRLARFLYPKAHLSQAELQYFTDVDHRDHEALIAVTRLRGEAVGVARFVRNREDSTSAEIALTVVDHWQGRGVGSMLATRLATRASCEDISHFTALMLTGNQRARRLLEKAGDITDVTRDGANVAYRVALPGPAPEPSRRRLITFGAARCA